VSGSTATRRGKVDWKYPDRVEWHETFPHFPPDIGTAAQCSVALSYYGDGCSLQFIAEQHGVRKQSIADHLGEFNRRVKKAIGELWGSVPPRDWTLPGGRTKVQTYPRTDQEWAALQRSGPAAGIPARAHRNYGKWAGLWSCAPDAKPDT